jgi:hypothetical protein
MNPKDVTAAFDEGHVYEDWMGGNLNDSLLYHGLILHFDRCNGAGPLPDSRLNWIVVHERDDAYLLDSPLTAWKKMALLDRLREEGLSPVLLDNGDLEVPWFWLSATFDAASSLVWFEMDSA